MLSQSQVGLQWVERESDFKPLFFHKQGSQLALTLWACRLHNVGQLSDPPLGGIMAVWLPFECGREIYSVTFRCYLILVDFFFFLFLCPSFFKLITLVSTLSKILYDFP